MAEAIQKMQKIAPVDKLIRAADTAARLKKHALSLGLALQAYDDKCRFDDPGGATAILKKFPLLEGVITECDEKIPPAVKALVEGITTQAILNAASKPAKR